MYIPVYFDGGDQNLYHDNLNQQMQENLSDNGWVAPSQTTANITAIAPKMPNGTHWYDEDTNEVKWIVNGVVRVMALV